MTRDQRLEMVAADLPEQFSAIERVILSDEPGEVGA